MRGVFGGALVAAVVAGAGPAGAASLEIRDAAVRVVVIPEARSDVSVTVLKTNPRLPLRVYQGPSGRTVVDGGHRTVFFGSRPIDCPAGGGVRVWGVGRFADDELPRILVRAPLDTRIEAGGGVFGSVSRARRLDLTVGGCGTWTLANVDDRLLVRGSGAVDVRAGAAGRMDLAVSGASRIHTRAAADGLEADVSGAGAITVERASGPIHVGVSGGGRVGIDGGQASLVEARVSGAGAVDFGGVAEELDTDLSGLGQITAASVTRRLDAEISGGGRMRIGQASGALRARISGSGGLRIAGGHATALEARLSGSGEVDFEGVADELDAEASGAGRVRVARVTGPVVRSTSGAGKVTIGP